MSSSTKVIERKIYWVIIESRHIYQNSSICLEMFLKYENFWNFLANFTDSFHSSFSKNIPQNIPQSIPKNLARNLLNNIPKNDVSAHNNHEWAGRTGSDVLFKTSDLTWVVYNRQDHS